MGVIQSRQRTISSRHQRAIDYALYQSKHSALEKYITNIFLYGSCARNEAKWSSDVDLCAEAVKNCRTAIFEFIKRLEDSLSETKS